MRPDVQDTGAAHRKQGARGSLRRIRSSPAHHHEILLFLAPAVVYLSVRSFGLVVLTLLSAANDQSVSGNLYSWDAQWYLEIATNGYDGVDPSMVDGFGNRSSETPLAFFPGYPLLIRLFTVIPGLGPPGAAITATLVAGVICAYGLARLGRRISGSHGTGLLFVALFAAAPMSVVLLMPYTEAVFCALSVWALVGVLERRWLLAGLCCAAAGLVRPTAAALIAVVGLAALIAVVRRREARRSPLPWLAMLLAPSGMLAYLGWVAARTGDLNGYFELQQRGWSSAFDGGLTTLRFALETLSTDKSVLETFTVWIVLAAVVLMVLCVRHRLPWPLVLFALLVLVLDLGSDGLMYSKVRLMLPAFPLLLPVALGLSNRRTTTAVATTALLVCFGTWFGAYSLTAWPYAM
ncbi:dolichyl-phosphate-mannose-protein mannosyltransferase [Halopolyspora algeriensis]|nr:dolichyl-phosphate-mannose-protein mannosyltransferase [Halopolyspora algeriensis]